MDKQRLDDRTAERILSGAIRPEDAPPQLADLTHLLRAAASIDDAMRGVAFSEDSMRASASERALIDAMSAAIVANAGSVARGRSWGRARHRIRAKVAAAVFASTLALGTGLAFAGALPGPLQAMAAHMLHKAGVTVPGHESSSGPDGGSTPTAAAPSTSRSPKGPDATGPAAAGLCSAQASGQGGANGSKNDSVAFQNLEKAAAAAGRTVDEYCGTVTSGRSGQSSGSNGNGSGSGNGQGSGKGNGKGKSSSAGSNASASKGKASGKP
jgi:hypothetical protein